ncbi:MAG: hypothetical protein K2M51_03290 [Helicobacter sp.]|nr:hypothetical protein [Helicobacter sp.]
MMAMPESSNQHVFKSEYRRIKMKDSRELKDWLQGLGAAFSLCMFSILFCTLIMMRFP